MLAASFGVPLTFFASALLIMWSNQTYSGYVLINFAIFLLAPMAASSLFFFGKRPAWWRNVGFADGFILGLMTCMALAERWPVLEGLPAVLLGLTLGVLGSWTAHLASRDWLDLLGQDLVDAGVEVPIRLRDGAGTLLLSPSWLRATRRSEAWYTLSGGRSATQFVSWRDVVAIEPGEISSGPAVRFVLAGHDQLIVPVSDPLLVASMCSEFVSRRSSRRADRFIDRAREFGDQPLWLARRRLHEREQAVSAQPAHVPVEAPPEWRPLRMQ
jgi:hypothetical protein